MRAEGRCCRWLRGGLLLGLLVQGCERAPTPERVPRPDAAVQGVSSPTPRFDLQREVAQLAEGESVSFEPTISDKYDAYVRLREGASEPELRELLHHAAPAVRVYAFHALA